MAGNSNRSPMMALIKININNKANFPVGRNSQNMNGNMAQVEINVVNHIARPQ
jgi:hypothetical protein